MIIDTDTHSYIKRLQNNCLLSFNNAISFVLVYKYDYNIISSKSIKNALFALKIPTINIFYFITKLLHIF